MGESRAFQVVRGESRSSERSTHLGTFLKGKINEVTYESIELLNLGLGILSLKMKSSKALSFVNGQVINLDLWLSDRKQISGNWLFTGSRKVGENTILRLERKEAKKLSKLSGHIDPELLLKGSGYKVFFTDKSQDQAELNKHLTDLKDFNLPISCNFSTLEGELFTTQFSFESQTKTFSTLDFSTQDFKIEKKENLILIGEYTFLSVRYIFQTTLSEFDKDFNLLSVNIPDFFIAITSRNFDRWECNVKADFGREDNSKQFNGTIVKVSPTGCEAEIIENEFKKNESIQIYLGELASSINAQVVSVRGNTVGVSFISRKNRLSEIRKLFFKTIKHPFVLREEKNYGKFQELYRKVGYCPKEKEESEKWKVETEAAWQIQDNILPGNTIGAEEKESITAAFGVVPLSKRVLYGHSIAMLKTIGSIGPFFDICVKNLAWAELLDNVEYYCGSTRRKSNFSTRLHNIFEFHSSPTSYRSYAALAVLPSSSNIEISNGTSSHEIVVWKKEYEKFLSNDLIFLSSLISEQENFFSEYHSIKIFGVWNKEKNNLEGLAVCHKSLPYFTAANILRCVWVFNLEDGVSLLSIYRALQANSLTQGMEADFFSTDLKKFITPEKQFADFEDVYWYFFSKQELGPVLASIARACWSVLRKYGSDAESYLKKFTK